MDLDPRSRNILQAVVEAYIDEAQPVSSSAVAARVRGAEKASPATIRAVMAELEETGLLSQPHTSAGRVPTEKGLRVYLDGLMSEKLHPWDRSRLDAAAAGDPADFPLSLGQTLSGLSGQLAIIAVPRFLGSRFREVGLVRYDRGRFLAYFLSPGGIVQQKMVEVDFDLTPEELGRVQNYLNERLQGRTLEDVRALVREQLDAAQSEGLLLARQALEICRQALPQPEVNFVVEGTSHLVQQPEFADVDKLRMLLRTLDDRQALLRLLDRVLDGQGVRVVLGSEGPLREVPDLACIGSTLAAGQGSHAAVSVVGPTRMDYGRLVPLVRYATELFDRYWLRL